VLSLNQTEEHPSYIALEQFGDDLYEATDGRLDVEVYPNETLGGQQEVLQLVGDGAVDMAVVPGTQMENISPDFRVLNLPTALDDIDHQLRVVSDEAIVGDLFTSVEDSNHLTVLGGLTQGSRHVYTAEGPIVEPSDLSGMKIRVQESSVHIDMINAMGAAATPMSYGEVYTALQSGVLDGAENNGISYMSQHHNGVATHMALTNHLVGLDYVVMNTDLLHSLPDEDREIFQQQWQLVSEHHAGLWTAETETAIAEAEDSGTEINDVDKAAFQEALRPVVEKYLDTPQDRELFEAIRREAQP
jgi:tripartite ATP-independent transporter DctP family solute receptor